MKNKLDHLFGLSFGCIVLFGLAAGCGPQTAQDPAASAQQEEAARLRAEVEQLPQARAENEEVQRLKQENQDLPKIRSQYQEAARLKKEYDQLRQQIARISPAAGAATAESAAAQ